MSVKKKRDLEGETAAESMAEGPESGPGTGEPDVEAATDPSEREAGGPSGEPQAGSAAGQAPPLDAVLELRIAALEAELAESKEQHLRKLAEFDNARKRLARDKEDSVRFANAALLADLVEVIDGLDRAIASSEVSKEFDALHSGVVLIEKQLVDTLERKWGLTRTRSLGESFDPMVHEAITMGESADGVGQVVLEEYQPGYTLHGRVVRAAKVKVSAPRSAGFVRATEGVQTGQETSGGSNQADAEDADATAGDERPGNREGA
jgi:molecular chaperone GrpE